MKRLFVFVLLVMLAGAVFAEGAKEVPREITILTGANETLPEFALALEKFAADYPDVAVRVLRLDLSDGSTLTMDAQLAAGTTPNIYQDYIGRVSKYLVPEFALDLTGYLRDIDKYNAGVLGPYTRGGKLLGLPQPAGVQGFAVNLDIAEAVGFEVRDDWTVAEFFDLAERVKQHYGGTKYVTGLFAANQSGDYLVNNWFAAFGASHYKAGDYSRTTIAETGGAKVYEFFQTLVRNGYVRDNSATLTDDDYVIHWASEEIAGGAFFQAWVKPYFDSVKSQGIGDGFRYKFVPFPRAEGVERVPTYASMGAIVVHRTDTVQDEWAARLAEYLNDGESQTMMSMVDVVPNRSDARMLSSSDHVVQTAIIAQRNGIMDVGLTTPMFAATRPQHFPVLQKVLNLELTPDEAIAEYERRLNDALSQ